MKVRDLLEELQKHGEENIDFYLSTINGDTRKVVPLTWYNDVVVKVKDKEGNPTNTIAITFWHEGLEDAKTI